MTRPLPTLRTAGDIVAAGLVPAAERASLEAVARRYTIAITPAMTALIDPRDAADPIARQFVPSPEELRTTAAERADPIGDEAHAPVPGIVHRYPDRVLLKITSVCPVYCRFCFRRESVGQGEDAVLPRDQLERALTYVANDERIFEVIVTGGDPLVLAPRRIAELTASLDRIPHAGVVRWHTRVPVVAPERVTPDMIAALTGTGKRVVLALHANHPRELGTAAIAAVSALHNAGIVLLSQTVLLRGVNDDADTLERLMRAFMRHGVKPYYLHHGDLAPGTSHLRTTLEHGQALMAELRRRLTGIALPAYVLDIPGGFGKVPVDAGHVGPADPATGERIVTDPGGRQHVYRDQPSPG